MAVPPGAGRADTRAGRRAEPDALEALVRQAAACRTLGSGLYGRLLDGLADDYRRGGLVFELLAGRSERPVHDALPLRLLGTVHRLVLAGRAPLLADHYPSVGGEHPGDPTASFLATVADHRAEVEAGLGRQVQTNEVSRAAALVGGFALVAARARLPFRQLEVGASAGLLLRWDRYWYDTGRSRLGDPDSPVRFTDDAWAGPSPDLTGPVDVAERRGCDIAPIDATTDEGRLTLLSFVWPDQSARLARLRAALDVADAHPVDIVAADAGAWLTTQLATPTPGCVTLVHHSIVLQYLSRPTLQTMREALLRAGARATPDAPVAWLRMEPAGPVADVRLTMWPGGDEELLGTTGYHGPPVRWAGPGQAS